MSRKLFVQQYIICRPLFILHWTVNQDHKFHNMSTKKLPSCFCSNSSCSPKHACISPRDESERVAHLTRLPQTDSEIISRQKTGIQKSSFIAEKVNSLCPFIALKRDDNKPFCPLGLPRSGKSRVMGWFILQRCIYTPCPHSEFQRSATRARSGLWL